MMSEQGRWFVLVALQLPELLAFAPLAGHSEPLGGWQAVRCLSPLLWGGLAAGCPSGGYMGGTYSGASLWLFHSPPSFVSWRWPCWAASEKEA